MKIKKLHIKNFKSIADLEIIEPNPFSVFIGPNGAGKSNIFEALEYSNYLFSWSGVVQMFGGKENILNHQTAKEVSQIEINYHFEQFSCFTSGESWHTLPEHDFLRTQKESEYNDVFHIISERLHRIFVNNHEKVKVNIDSNISIRLDASNLEKVLKRILKDESKKEEILDWIRLFIPEFDDVFIESSELSRTDTLIIKERYSDKYFTKELISDGTYNILALLTAVYQSDEPQFLCIEEPENGLNPRVVKELVGFFRYACEEKGHYIWLNTHSQTLVSELTPDEVITVDKIKGETKIKQFKGEDFHGLSMDEAWLTNTLGGGLPW